MKENSHSLRIQIGGNNTRPRDFSNKSNNEKSSFNGAVCPVECREEQSTKVDKYNNDFKSDQSVVKLQFKNAVIVIESGKNNLPSQVKLVNKCTDEPDSHVMNKTILWNGMEIASSPKRRFSSEEYLDLETKYRDKVANEMNESPTSKLLISDRSIKVPYNYLRETTRMKDWRSSEDLVRKLP